MSTLPTTRTNEKRMIIIFASLAVLLLTAAGIIWWKMQAIPEAMFPDMQTDFNLQGAQQQQIKGSDFIGKVALVYFGYMRCPDICPDTMVRLANVIKQLDDDERQKVQVIFISVDTEHDTPDKTDAYAKHFHPDFIGLTGSNEQVMQAAQGFLVGFRKDKDEKAKGGYSMSHSSYIFAVRPDGQIGTLLQHDDDPQRILAKARYWMRWAE
ncbi:MAG: SCO family protein [Mariprofundales bacterium]